MSQAGKTSEEIRRIAGEQGWTEVTLLGLLLDWLDDRQDSEVEISPGEVPVVDRLREVQEAENS